MDRSAAQDPGSTTRQRQPSPTERRAAPPRQRRRRVVGAFTLLIVLGVLLAVVATPVAAHAYLGESDPANGEQVDALPDEVTLYFSGDGVVTADVTVENPDGEEISTDPQIDPDDTQIVRVPIDDADGDDGMYTVEWEVLADDGHTTSGAFFFAVGDEPVDRDAVVEALEEGEEEDDVSAPEAGAKGLVLVSLVAIVGAPVTLALAVYPVTGRFASARGVSTVDRRATRLLAGAGVILFASLLALGLTRSASLGGVSSEAVREFVATPLGRVWLLQVVLGGSLAATLVGSTRGILPRRGWLATAFGGGLAVTATVGWTSHSATAIDRLQGLAVDFAHVLGAGLWVGGLLALAIVVAPLLRETDPDDRPALAAGIIRRYSVVALGGVVLAVATGLLLAAWHVPSFEGLVETLYGLTLSAKTLLVLVAFGLGGLTRFVLLRRLEGLAGSERPADGTQGTTFRADGDGGQPATGTVGIVVGAIRLEVAVLLVVIVLSGLLTTAPTAAMVAEDEVERASLDREVDDVLVELSAIPGADGDDAISVAEGEPVVFDVAFERDGERVDSDRTVRLFAVHEASDTRLEFEVEPGDDGLHSTVQTLPEAGDWQIRADGEPDGTFVSEWFDVSVSPAEVDGDQDGTDHDHGGSDHDDDQGGTDHDHGGIDQEDDQGGTDHEHDHGGHDHGQHDVVDDGEEAAFAVTLRFGAIVVAILGGFAVTFEALRAGLRGTGTGGE